MNSKKSLVEQNKKKKIMYFFTIIFIVFCIILAVILRISEVNSQDKFFTGTKDIPTKVQFQRDGKLQEGTNFNIELADTSAKKEVGLMNRDSLDSKSGMLFVFNFEQPLSFWMKNTLIPLDIIFMDKNKKVVKIYKNATPIREDLTYVSTGMYVLEINGGLSDKLDIKEGDTILFQSITN
ncbi:MAG: DUF192 domain-containing protein [bacterium]